MPDNITIKDTDKTVLIKKKKISNTTQSIAYSIAICTTSFLTWGMISSFPVLFVAFLDRYEGSRWTTSIIGSLQVGLLYMFTVIPGYLIPIYGFRPVLAAGSLFLACGLIFSIFVPGTNYLYITIGILTSLGASILMTGSECAPLIVFDKWRSTVTIFSQVCCSLGYIVLPITTDFLLKIYGLNGALLLLSGIMLQCLILSLLYPAHYRDIITTSNQNTSTFNIWGKIFKVMKKPSFWLMIGGSISLDSLSNGCRVFLLDKAISEGVNESSAVTAISIWGVFSALSSLAVNIPMINGTSTRRQVSLAIVTLSWSLVTFGSTIFTSYAGFLTYCILAGCFHGFNNVLWYLVLADTTDKDLLVLGYSIISFIAGPYVMISVPVSGVIYDKTRNYDIPYTIFAGIALVGGICEAFIPYFERQ